MEKKQTAVQWLKQKIKEQGVTHYFSINELIKQSLQMEREKIEEEYDQDPYGGLSGNRTFTDGEDYYKKTFNP